MPISIEDIQRKIEDTERELTELKTTLRVLERLNGKPHQLAAPTLSESGEIILDDLHVPEKAKKSTSTLNDSLTNIINRMGSQEFTVRHVEAALIQSGKGSNAKHFRNRVSIGIRKLSENGVITRIHKGVGNDPHKYVNTAEAQNLIPITGADAQL